MEGLENIAISYIKGNLTFTLSEFFTRILEGGKGINKQLLGDKVLNP